MTDSRKLTMRLRCGLGCSPPWTSREEEEVTDSDCLRPPVSTWRLKDLVGVAGGFVEHESCDARIRSAASDCVLRRRLVAWRAGAWKDVARPLLPNQLRANDDPDVVRRLAVSPCASCEAGAAPVTHAVPAGSLSLPCRCSTVICRKLAEFSWEAVALAPYFIESLEVVELIRLRRMPPREELSSPAALAPAIVGAQTMRFCELDRRRASVMDRGRDTWRSPGWLLAALAACSSSCRATRRWASAAAISVVLERKSRDTWRRAVLPAFCR
mmetsp:Transcript_8477/g.24910  ORF Transcript_8477/g.24910 Transcript_8477/m.24910 type:complete len:270 (-) Transcript_8477:548-1357(-)